MAHQVPPGSDILGSVFKIRYEYSTSHLALLGPLFLKVLTGLASSFLSSPAILGIGYLVGRAHSNLKQRYGLVGASFHI